MNIALLLDKPYSSDIIRDALAKCRWPVSSANYIDDVTTYDSLLIICENLTTAINDCINSATQDNKPIFIHFLNPKSADATDTTDTISMSFNDD